MVAPCNRRGEIRPWSSDDKHGRCKVFRQCSESFCSLHVGGDGFVRTEGAMSRRNTIVRFNRADRALTVDAPSVATSIFAGAPGLGNITARSSHRIAAICQESGSGEFVNRMAGVPRLVRSLRSRIGDPINCSITQEARSSRFVRLSTHRRCASCELMDHPFHRVFDRPFA